MSDGGASLGVRTQRRGELRSSTSYGLTRHTCRRGSHRLAIGRRSRSAVAQPARTRRFLAYIKAARFFFGQDGWMLKFSRAGVSGAGKAPGKSRSALVAGERAMRGGLCRPRDSDWVRPVAPPVLSHHLAVVTEAHDSARLRAACDFVWREGRPSTSRVELAKRDQAAEPRYRGRNRHHLSHRVSAKRVNSPTVRSDHLVARPQCIAARDRLENRGASTAAPAS